MSKDAFYFSHDSNARNDEKIIALRMKHNWLGYGLYWALIEKLRESTCYKLTADYNLLAFDLRTDSAIIKSIICDFGLFAFVDDDECFYSESLMRRMELAGDRSEKARNAAAMRWQSKRNANALQPHSEGNAIKERKEKKEKKENESKESPPSLFSVPSANEKIGNASAPAPRGSPAEMFGDIAPGEMMIPMEIAGCIEMYFSSAYFTPTREMLCMKHFIDDNLLRDWGDAFGTFLIKQGTNAKTLKDWASHFGNWLPKQDLLNKNPKKLYDYEQPTRKESGGKEGLNADYKRDLARRMANPTGKS